VLHGQAAHLLRRVEDRPVAGAAAQIPRQFFLRQFARDALAAAHMVLVHPEQAHHEAGRAKAALGAVVSHHRLLGRMQASVFTCEVFHGPQSQAIDGMGQPDAAVDRLVADRFALAARPGRDLAQHDGAGTAVALAAAFLGAGCAQVFAQHFQQRALGWYIVQRDDLAAPDESEGLGFHAIQYGLFWRGGTARVTRIHLG
jgi:hypothetical protein